MTHQALTLEAGPNPRLNLTGRRVDRNVLGHAPHHYFHCLPKSGVNPLSHQHDPIMIMAAPDTRLKARAALGPELLAGILSGRALSQAG